MNAPGLKFDAQHDVQVLRLSGHLVVAHLEAVRPQFERIAPGDGPYRIDLDGLDAPDTGGAWLIATLKLRLEAQGLTVDLVDGQSNRAALIQTAQNALPDDEGIV